MNGSGYLAQDTIAAIASALGGAVAIIRVSGPRAFEITQAIGAPHDVEARKLVRATLTDEDAPLDDALVAKFISPASFTGEDMVELHVHGGAFVAARVLEALCARGARRALPGEFSFRAVRGGKLSLSQAQAIPDLIGAASDSALSLALEKLSGSQARIINDAAEGLRKLAALGEVGIDFSDQDVDEVSLPALKKQLEAIRAGLSKLHASYARGLRLQEGLSLSFIGLPNAGKSSFFNALLGEERSIVSEAAGTTRDLVREKITLRGRAGMFAFRLEDTAGLRGATDSIEQQGIERSLKAAATADIVLFLLDPKGDLGAAESEWRSLERRCGPSLREKSLGLITKSDLHPSARAPETIPICKWIACSAVTREGIDETIEQLLEIATRLTARAPGEVLLTRQDHADSVAAALAHLERASNALEIELFAADLKMGLHALSPLIGATPVDDVLGRVFSDFCIGK